MSSFADEIPSGDDNKNKGKSKPKEQVYIDVSDNDNMNLFDKVAGFKSAIKVIQGELEIAEDTLKDYIRKKFVENGMRSKVKPESIEAQGNVSTATVTLKKGISVIDPETIGLFKSLGINYTTSEKVGFKKSVLEDEDKVKKIIDLMKKNGFKIGDYFERTEKLVPSDRTMNDILDKVNNPDVIENFFRKVGTVAIGTPSFDGDSLKAKEKIVGILDKSGIFKVAEPLAD
jgi:hypothetical protein